MGAERITVNSDAKDSHLKDYGLETVYLLHQHPVQWFVSDSQGYFM